MRNVAHKIERYLSKTIYNTSISGAKFSWTNLYRKRDLDALKRRQIGSDNRGGDSGDGRANLGFEQEPVIFARRNPPAYELELIGQLTATLSKYTWSKGDFSSRNF